MVAPRKIKQIEGIQKKLNQLYKNINFEELNYGEVKIDENSNFILDEENEIIRYKEDYLSQQTTEKMINLLKSYSENDQFIKQLINKDDTNKLITNDNNNKDNQINEDVDRKSTRLNSSHVSISYAVFCLKKKNKQR